MSTTVQYGNYDFGNQPTPFLTRSEESILHGEKWGTREIFNIRGQFSGCDFNTIRTAQIGLISGFAQDFNNLTITSDGGYVFTKTGLKVNSIDFPSNPYKNLLDYNIQLSYYPEDYFYNYGVTNPVNSWSFDETKDELLNITHTISCKGFRTNKSAFENAKNFVNARTGYQEMINPHFICKNTYPEFYPCLTDISENINRINGEYSITETYISDLAGTGKGVLRYSVDLDSGINDLSTLSIQGNVDGCRSDSMDSVRAKFKEFRLFDTACQIYENQFGIVDLNPIAVSSGITEDRLNKKLNFTVSFDNDFSSSTTLDLQTNVVSGDSFISVSLDGNIRGRGDIFDRRNQIEQKFSGINIYNLANTAYLDYLNGSVNYPLNPKAEASGYSKDPFTPQISFSAKFTNKEISPSGFESFNRNINFTPSLRQIKANPLFGQNGTYDVIDLLYDSRARLSVSINGQASPNESPDNLTQTMKSEANLLLSTYGSTNGLILDSYNISTGNLGDYSLGASWSFDADNTIITGSIYDQIVTLKLK